MNVRWFAAVAICLGLLLAACSKSQAPSASTTSAVKLGPCGGLDAAQAAAILHIPASAVTGPQQLRTFSCIYRSRKDYYKSITFNVYVEKSAAVAQRNLDKLKDGLAVLSKIVAVGGLGDAAWRAPDSRVRRLLARKGAVWIDIVTPGDEASQVHIARIVLGHLQ